MFATQEEGLTTLFILWVSSAAMVVTSALMVVVVGLVVVIVFFRLIVNVTLKCHNGSLNGDLRSNFSAQELPRVVQSRRPGPFFYSALRGGRGRAKGAQWFGR